MILIVGHPVYFACCLFRAFISLLVFFRCKPIFHSVLTCFRWLCCVNFNNSNNNLSLLLPNCTVYTTENSDNRDHDHTIKRNRMGVENFYFLVS